MADPNTNMIKDIDILKVKYLIKPHFDKSRFHNIVKICNEPFGSFQDLLLVYQHSSKHNTES